MSIKCKKITEKQLEAVSLIEVSFVMIIAGFLMMMAMQGWKYVEQAKLYGMVQQITQIRMAYDETKNSMNLTTENFMQELEQRGGPKTKENMVYMAFAICKCEQVYPPVLLLTDMKETHAKRLKGMLESHGENVQMSDVDEKQHLKSLKIDL